MSASRRRAQALAVEAVYRMAGPVAARVWVDRRCATGIRCPACAGDRIISWTLRTPASPSPQARVVQCSLCLGHGALRPRPIGDRQRGDDQSTVAGNQP